MMTLGYPVTVLAMIRVGEAIATLRRASADDDRPGLYRRWHSAYLLYLSR